MNASDSPSLFHAERITGAVRGIPIRWKLALLITAVTTSVLIAVIAVFTRYDTEDYLQNKRMRKQMIAEIIGINCIPALRFGDQHDAAEILASLSAAPTVHAAYLFDASDKLVAHYLLANESLSVPILSNHNSRDYIDGNRYIVIHNIESKGAAVGTLYISSDLSDVHALQRENVMRGAMIGVLFCVLAFILAFVAQGLFTKPLLDLAGIIRRVTETKDFSLRAERQSNDEFGVLVAGFNSMLGELERREQTLAQQMTLLERTNKELDQFVYVASHDLKAPLRAVENLAQLIARATKDVLPEKSRDYLDLMQNRVRRMERLLNDLLDYSRIGRVQGKQEVVNVRTLLQDIVHLLDPPRSFRVVLPESPFMLYTYRVPLEQVLRNLISNAIKHHDKPGGTIEVRVSPLHNGLEFAVCDDGPGIAPRYHEKVFQMFQTLRPRDEVEGSGMGLALVKKIVLEQGGAVWLKSAEGSGTCVHFSWPGNEPTEKESLRPPMALEVK